MRLLDLLLEIGRGGSAIMIKVMTRQLGGGFLTWLVALAAVVTCSWYLRWLWRRNVSTGDGERAIRPAASSESAAAPDGPSPVGSLSEPP